MAGVEFCGGGQEGRDWPSVRLTYDPQLGVGVDLAVLVPGHALVHPRVGQRQPADAQRPVGHLHALLRHGDRGRSHR